MCTYPALADLSDLHEVFNAARPAGVGDGDGAVRAQEFNQIGLETRDTNALS
jgi:hypothetical protein